MFETLQTLTGFSQNDVETMLFTISHSNNTNNIELVADNFMETHVSQLQSDTPECLAVRKEVEIYLQGCDDIEAQRSVRRRRGDVDDAVSAIAVESSGCRPSNAAGKHAGVASMEGEDVRSRSSASASSSKPKRIKTKKSKKVGRPAPAQAVSPTSGLPLEGPLEGGVGEDVLAMTNEDGGEGDVVIESVIDDSEVLTKEDAYVKLKDMRVTVETDDMVAVQKKPPTTASQVLSSLKMNRGLMTHCVIGETDTRNVRQPDAVDQKCNTFCFVSKMDPKGSTPPEIQEIVYLLDMMNRYYTNQRPPPNGRGVDDIFDVPKVGVNGAKSLYKNGAVYHKMQLEDDNVTVPILKMKLFIEQANTGGESPLVLFFMFLVVEVPITFDLTDAVYRSCTKQSFATKDKLICEDMKRTWVNVAYRHQTFSGGVRQALESMLKIEFNDLFDSDSVNCFQQLFRIPRCIQQARQHMHMWAVDNITNRSNIPVEIANVLVNIRFNKIDAVFDSQCPSLLSDAIFSNMSNLCASSYADSLDKYKRSVAAFRSAGKKKTSGGGGGDDMDEDGQGDGEVQPHEMPVFDPPVIVSTPTHVDWSCEETKAMILKLVVECTVECPADCLRILDEHLANYPGSVRMNGFPITDMVAYLDSSMLLPHSSAYVGIAEWLVENRECALPDQMTMCILVMMYQKNVSSRAIFLELC